MSVTFRIRNTASLGLLISLLFSGVGTTEQIVETESRVVLEVGTRGILPCRIQRKAHLVQWTRHLISEHLLVYLNPYANVDLRGGPGYTEELFNITEDYSLIIKDVKVQDEGLYICEVSDFQTGKVFRNKTRVSVRGTGASVALEVGTQGILPCRIQRGAYEVKWKRQLSSDMSETELLVSLDQFFNVGERVGPGYRTGLFNITDDYSLVIKDVKVQDEGLYMCTLFDLKTGRVSRNSTRVFVQALPREPFPIIQECVGKPGACTLTVHSASNLTCHVKGYYPDIDLFFLHGSENITSTEYEEWNNADGTKNKNIGVQISASDKPYECVATRLPGMVGNRSVSVIVQAQDHPQANSQDPNAAVIVVPVIVGICLFVLIAAISRYHRRNDRDFVAPEGCISKLELWQLIKFAEENNDFEKLRKVVRRLLNTGGLTLETSLDFYESLSTWKYETSFTCNQRENLYSVCNELGMANITRKLIDVIMDAFLRVPKSILLHILWEIKEPSKITKLLEDLQLDHKTVASAVKQGRREVVYRAHRELLEWRKGEFHINPLVILSLKLDDLECETNFFKLSLSEMEDLDVNEMRGRSSQFSRQHVRHLLRVSGGINGEDLSSHIETLVQENHESLFDTIQMLQDWIQSEECSNYEIRKKLRKGAEASLQRDHTAVDKWPPDDELRVIASFLSPASMGPLCSKLGIKSPPQEASEEERFQALAEWRDSHASSKDLLEKHARLIDAHKEVERKGLIPRVKDHLVYKVELVDLAFHLFARDLLPFTEVLGISAAKLVDYRRKFHPSHMEQGTIGLLCKLLESWERTQLSDLMKEMPYPNVIASGMLALEISCGELYAVSLDSPKQRGMQKCHTVRSNTCLEDEVKSLPSRSSLETSRTENQGDVTNDESIQKHSEYDFFGETTKGFKTMLASTVKVKDQDLTSTESTVREHFTLSRKLSCLSPFSCRLALAEALRIVGNNSQAYALIRGDYEKGSIPFTFIYDILRNMTSDQLYYLHSLIRNTGSIPFALELSVNPLQEEGWFKMTAAVSQETVDWIGKWIKQWNSLNCKEGDKDPLSTTEIAKKHKEFNDKLVDLGFVDLAREIMISEQQLI